MAEEGENMAGGEAAGGTGAGIPRAFAIFFALTAFVFARYSSIPGFVH
jgi:hypothetical protein